MYKKVTLKELAQLLHVSPSTVSLALRNSPGISPSTKEKIIRVAKEMGYRPIADKKTRQTNFTLSFNANDSEYAQSTITIYSIAKQVGVSAATVSRALNGCTKLNRETVKIIKTTAKVMGYHSNLAARNLRTGGINKVSQHGPKAVTIYDIAQAVNLSPATVSRYIKDSNRVNSEIQHKVLETAKLMGYKTNEAARQLRVKEKPGPKTPKLEIKSLPEIFDNIDFHQLLKIFENVAHQAGYYVTIHNQT